MKSHLKHEGDLSIKVWLKNRAIEALPANYRDNALNNALKLNASPLPDGLYMPMITPPIKGFVKPGLGGESLLDV